MAPVRYATTNHLLFIHGHLFSNASFHPIASGTTPEAETRIVTIKMVHQVQDVTIDKSVDRNKRENTESKTIFGTDHLLVASGFPAFIGSFIPISTNY